MILENNNFLTSNDPTKYIIDMSTIIYRAGDQFKKYFSKASIAYDKSHFWYSRYYFHLQQGNSNT